MSRQIDKRQTIFWINCRFCLKSNVCYVCIKKFKKTFKTLEVEKYQCFFFVLGKEYTKRHIFCHVFYLNVTLTSLSYPLTFLRWQKRSCHFCNEIFKILPISDFVISSIPQKTLFSFLVRARCFACFNSTISSFMFYKKTNNNSTYVPPKLFNIQIAQFFKHLSSAFSDLLFDVLFFSINNQFK